MGLETFIIPPNILETSSDLSELEIRLLQLGWEKVNFGFSLGRHNGALDLIEGSDRILIYPVDPQDESSYHLLEHANVPRLELAQRTRQLTLAKLPINVKALDSMRFTEQQPMTGYLGAFEVLDGVAKLLSFILKKTHSLPVDPKLHKLSLIAGSTDIIRLVPPLNLQPATDWRNLITALSADLNEQDPPSKHNTQMEYFNNRFQYYLSLPDHD